MNDSHEMKIAAECLCCARLYMQTVVNFETPEPAACPRCAAVIQKVFASASTPGWWRNPINRLALYD